MSGPGPRRRLYPIRLGRTPRSSIRPLSKCSGPPSLLFAVLASAASQDVSFALSAVRTLLSVLWPHGTPLPFLPSVIREGCCRSLRTSTSSLLNEAPFNILQYLASSLRPFLTPYSCLAQSGQLSCTPIRFPESSLIVQDPWLVTSDPFTSAKSRSRPRPLPKSSTLSILDQSANLAYAQKELGRERVRSEAGSPHMGSNSCSGGDQRGLSPNSGSTHSTNPRIGRQRLPRPSKEEERLQLEMQ